MYISFEQGYSMFSGKHQEDIEEDASNEMLRGIANFLLKVYTAVN